VGFEPTISVLERAKTVRALDRSTTVIGFQDLKRKLEARGNACGSFSERERERREIWTERGVVRDTTVMESKQNLAVLKVPRQWPLVLLVEARLVFGICSVLNFKDVGAAVVGRNIV
jgi:hypothetical protein